MSHEMLSTFGEMLRAFRKRSHLTQQQLAAALGMHYNTIGGWERGDSLPDKKRIVLELVKRLHLDYQESRQLLEASLAAMAPHWNIPIPRNPFFTGREEVLDTLHTHLDADQLVTTQSYAIYGLGGIGKTQLAVEYAYRYVLEYAAVFWIAAESVENILASFLAIAELLRLPVRQEANQQRMVAAVQRWLSSHGEWLLIWDNLEDVALLQRYLPPARSGAVLITTRCQAFGGLAQNLELSTMTQDEGILLLLRRAKILTSRASKEHEAHLAVSQPALYRAAQEVVTALDGLPLALDQAGAYIEATRCSLSDYAQLFRSSPLRLLDERDAYMDHPRSVTRTFTLTFERLEQSHPSAAEVLTVCAFLAPEAIPEAVFIEGAAHLGATFEKLAADPFAFHATLKALLAYSLIQRNATTHMLTIHRLVQAVLKGRLLSEDWHIWARRVIRAITSLFPSDEELQTDYWQAGERLLPHAFVCLTLSEQVGEDEALRITLLNHVAGYLGKRARYAEAKLLLERARSLGEQALSPEHPLIAETLYALAELFRWQGTYAQAEVLFARALHLWEHLLGPEHLQTTEALNNLGVVFYEQGKYEQAEPLLQRALQTWEQALGAEHPKVARSLNNLGLLYWRQGRYEQAQPVFQRALCIRELVLGPQHFQVGTSLNNLAYLYTAQGKYEQAEPLLQRALQIWEQALGSEHLQVVYPLYGLAKLYTEQGRYEQAELFYQRALAIGEQALGSQHPSVAEALTHLGTLYQKQGQYQEAEPLYLRALRIWEVQLGSMHPLVAGVLTELATLYSEQGQYAQARALFAHALQIWEQTGETESLQIAQGDGRQTKPLGEQQPDEPIASLRERTLALAERSPHLLHPGVAETVHGLACLHQRQHQIAEALSLYRYALTLHEQFLGARHPKTMKTREALLDLLARMEQVKESTTLYDQMPKSASPCACGCGREIDTSKSRGEPRRFFSTACKQRFYRNASRRKRNVVPGLTMTSEEITP